jgi:ribosomal protein S18 acetylase RimI-like enzyme
MQFLAVRPEHRGHGHGHDLVTRGLEFAKSAGYRSAELVVMPEFEYARKIYEGMGFKHVDTYLWQGSNVLTFEKDL